MKGLFACVGTFALILLVSFQLQAQVPAAPENIGYGFGGSWYNPDTDAQGNTLSGQGFNIEFIQSRDSQGNTVKQVGVYWYTFNKAGTEKTWLIAVGPLVGNTVTADLLESEQYMRFNRPQPSTPQRVVGRLTAQLIDCNTINLTWTFNQTIPRNGIGPADSGSQVIRRLTPIVNIAGFDLCSTPLEVIVGENGDYDELYADYLALDRLYDTLVGEYNDLADDYDDLFAAYNTCQDDLEDYYDYIVTLEDEIDFLEDEIAFLEAELVIEYFDGYDAGYEDGYYDGYIDGYNDGYEDGSFFCDSIYGAGKVTIPTLAVKNARKQEMLTRAKASALAASPAKAVIAANKKKALSGSAQRAKAAQLTLKAKQLIQSMRAELNKAKKPIKKISVHAKRAKKAPHEVKVNK
jgi:hypothetical protein